MSDVAFWQKDVKPDLSAESAILAATFDQVAKILDAVGYTKIVEDLGLKDGADLALLVTKAQAEESLSIVRRALVKLVQTKAEFPDANIRDDNLISDNVTVRTRVKLAGMQLKSALELTGLYEVATEGEECKAIRAGVNIAHAVFAVLPAPASKL